MKIWNMETNISATKRLRVEGKNPAHPAIALASVLAPAAQVHPMLRAKPVQN